jgi:DNA-binding response OmpR family regulator
MRTILFADDNKHICEHCKRELEDEGYRVLLACDGAEATRIARRELPDLVILDISMPRTDGLEAARRIKSTVPSMPVIFFTLHDDVCPSDPRSRVATACVEKCEDLTELKRVISATLTAGQPNPFDRFGLPPSVPSDSASSE